MQPPRYLLPIVLLNGLTVVFIILTSNVYNYRTLVIEDEMPNKVNPHLITIFTICRPWHQGFVAFENILRNWITLSMKGVNVILYNDFQLRTELLMEPFDYNWTILTIPQVNTHRGPSFGDLFLDSASKFNATYSVYADCGVLFNEDFEETLNFMQSYLEGDKSVLLVGKHSAIKSSDKTLTNTEEIKRISWTEGVPQETNCSSYLIIGNIHLFPWEPILPIEIGQSGCSDLFVAEAVKHGVTTVDATETISALLQVNDTKRSYDQILKYSDSTSLEGHAPDLIGNLPYKTVHSPWGKLHLSQRDNLPLMTLFTTFRPLKSKFSIHLNVIRNWALFVPHVIPVLFNTSTDPELIQIALKHKWTILPVPRVNPNGLPYFKDMFIAARNSTHSTFYGYCNGDILFSSGLHKTLTRLQTVRALFNQTLIIGRRSNFNFSDVKQEAIFHFDRVESTYLDNSQLFTPDAEDYFFIDAANFPWNSLKDIVIGRPAYDNYIVAEAIRLNVTVIDATQTIPALHQTGRDGNKAGHKGSGAKWNKNIVGKHYNYGLGHTTRAPYRTQMLGQEVMLINSNNKALAL